MSSAAHGPMDMSPRRSWTAIRGSHTMAACPMVLTNMRAIQVSSTAKLSGRNGMERKPMAGWREAETWTLNR